MILQLLMVSSGFVSLTKLAKSKVMMLLQDYNLYFNLFFFLSYTTIYYNYLSA